MSNLLFVCSKNRKRSPTAEAVFADDPMHEVASAGLNQDSAVPLDVELIEWADVIFVMEPEHRSRLMRRFGRHVHRQRVVNLGIADVYEPMDVELMQLIERRVRRALG